CVVSSWKQVGVFFVVGALCYSPVIVYAHSNWHAFTYRYSVVAGTSPEAIVKAMFDPTPQARQILADFLESLRRHLLMFHVRGDANGRHNLPGAPMLDFVTGGLFGLGLLCLLVHVFDWRSILFGLWFCMSLSAGIFSVDFEAPQGARTFGMTPMIAIVSAVPLAALFRCGQSLLVRGALRLAAVGVLGYVSLGNLHNIFGEQRDYGGR